MTLGGFEVPTSGSDDSFIARKAMLAESHNVFDVNNVAVSTETDLAETI